MQPLGLLLVVLATVHGLRQNQEGDVDAMEQPAIITGKGRQTTVAMHDTTYEVNSIYESLKEIRFQSQAMRKELKHELKTAQQEAKNEAKDPFSNIPDWAGRVVEHLPEKVKLVWGAIILGSWWLGAKEKAMHNTLSAEQLMTRVFQSALGYSYQTGDDTDVNGLVAKLVHNLLDIGSNTATYELAFAQRAEIEGDQVRKLLWPDSYGGWSRDKDKIKFTKRRQELTTLSNFLEDLQDVSNQKEVLEAWQVWKGPLVQPFFFLGAMINELVHEAELWTQFFAAASPPQEEEPGAESE